MIRSRPNKSEQIFWNTVYAIFILKNVFVPEPKGREKDTTSALVHSALSDWETVPKIFQSHEMMHYHDHSPISVLKILHLKMYLIQYEMVGLRATYFCCAYQSTAILIHKICPPVTSELLATFFTSVKPD